MAKVLVAEDQKIMRHTIKKILTELGHEVVAEAEDGHKAIEKYKFYKPDIVTMDITMPAKKGIESGIDALVAIKEEYPDANIIMMTSHGEQELVVDAITKGAKGYILKPISKAKIEETFSKLAL